MFLRLQSQIGDARVLVRSTISALRQREVQVERRRVMLRVVEEERRQRDVGVTWKCDITRGRRRDASGGGCARDVVVSRQVVLYLQTLERYSHRRHVDVGRHPTAVERVTGRRAEEDT